ncbi:MFS transporter [uncultured Nostoc sp.]|uniref:MFS transporter n=1 Tax=uncultured Nostoc sp. TaxID=340711 RepID=UPI0035CA22DE
MPTSAWSPLRKSLFRDRQIASIVSNIGGWMEDTAGAWLMTSLTTSPLLVALMQTAAMNGPAWQAIVPELVPRSELMAAIALI